MEPGSPIVEIRGLRFAYGKRAVLKGVDLDIPSGKVSAILGSSGSGKTTLLQLICGLLKPAPAPCGCAARKCMRSIARVCSRCAAAWA
jgi:ABC-type transporter Mla maintaining outer membrane lipid asymmetry ATPase subunit MlaF